MRPELRFFCTLTVREKPVQAAPVERKRGSIAAHMASKDKLESAEEEPHLAAPEIEIAPAEARIREAHACGPGVGELCAGECDDGLSLSAERLEELCA